MHINLLCFFSFIINTNMDLFGWRKNNAKKREFRKLLDQKTESSVDFMQFFFLNLNAFDFVVSLYGHLIIVRHWKGNKFTLFYRFSIWSFLLGFFSKRTENFKLMHFFTPKQYVHQHSTTPLIFMHFVVGKLCRIV